MIGALAAFAVAVAWWPDFAEPGNTAKWAVASVIVPFALVNRRQFDMTAAHWIGLAWLAYAALSVSWSPSPLDSLDCLWRFSVLAGAFVLGGVVEPRHIVAGFAAGVSVSGLVVLGEVSGVLEVAGSVKPAGLFGMKNYVAEAGLIALAGAAAYRMWWAVPLTAAAAFLPASKAVWVSAIVLAGLVAATRGRWGRYTLAAICVLLAALGAAFWNDPALYTLPQRAEMWRHTIGGLVPWGHGIGAYWAAFPAFQSGASAEIYGWSGMPAHAHNDLLTMVAETGIATVLLAGIAWMAACTKHPARWPFLAFLLCGVAAFPLYNPATGVVGALLAGALCRARLGLRGDEP